MEAEWGIKKAISDSVQIGKKIKTLFWREKVTMPVCNLATIRIRVTSSKNDTIEACYQIARVLTDDLGTHNHVNFIDECHNWALKKTIAQMQQQHPKTFEEELPYIRTLTDLWDIRPIDPAEWLARSIISEYVNGSVLSSL